jgi:hypothetical protein
VVLLVPDLEPIILSNLNFACYDASGSCSRFIIFKKEAVLSFKSPFGEVIGIALQHHDKSALHPDSRTLSYTMSFEKVHYQRLSYKNFLNPNLNRKANPTSKLTNNSALIHHKNKPSTS